MLKNAHNPFLSNEIACVLLSFSFNCIENQTLTGRFIGRFSIVFVRVAYTLLQMNLQMEYFVLLNNRHDNQIFHNYNRFQTKHVNLNKKFFFSSYATISNSIKQLQFYQNENQMMLLFGMTYRS